MIPGTGITRLVATEGMADFEHNTMEAAAMMAMGISVKTHKFARERDGSVQWAFHYNPGQTILGGSITPRQIVNWHRNGDLEKKDPSHPYLWSLTALRNRERILEWILRGRTAALRKHPRVDRWQYEPSPRAELPAAMIGVDGLGKDTPELKVVCVLGCFGIPMIRARGPVRDAIFELCHTGFPGAETPPHTAQLAEDFRTGELDRANPQHPFFFAWSAIECIQTLKRHMQAEITNLWIEKPKSKNAASAFLRADATSKARDKVLHHFRRVE